MTVTTPLSVDSWPAFQVWTKKSWATGAWVQQPMVNPNPVPGRAGFEVVRLTRACLPDYGMAILRYRYGLINGRNFGPSADGALNVPDLGRQEVRVLAVGNDGLARTIWWGTVEHQADTQCAPGSVIEYATREYHCFSGISRMRHWSLRTHGALITTNSFQANAAIGHPGFNTSRWDGTILGNKDVTGTLYDPYGDISGYVNAYYHCYAGGGNRWSDREAAETAMVSARPPGEVKFRFSGAVGLLSGTGVWPVKEGEPVFDLLQRICRRQRGRGVVFDDWDETPGNLNSFSPKLTICSQFINDISYTPPGLGTVTLPGAGSAGTTTTVDLIGDHRIGMDGAATFEIGTRDEHTVDYLETVGEPIQVMATLSYKDNTLSERWGDSEATAYKAASYDARLQGRWDGVYQLHGLSRAWDGICGDGTGSNKTRADFRCGDDGIVVNPATFQTDTSPILVQIMRDLPMYSEYDYTSGNATRYDGLAADQAVPPVRRPPIVWYNAVAGANTEWCNLSQVPNQLAIPQLAGYSYSVSEYGIKIFCTGDDGNGVRTIGDPTDASLNSLLNYKRLAVTVGLQLPHRVRFATGVISQAARIMRIEHRNHHLWLAHPGAMWDIDPTNKGTYGYAAKTGAANPNGGAFGTLRDDSAPLAQLHNLAWSWYGTERRTGKWSLHACGMLPTGTTLDAAGKSQQTAFPTMGQLVTGLSAMGRTWTLNTPITAIHYDNDKGVTTWITDWSTLEWSYA